MKNSTKNLLLIVTLVLSSFSIIAQNDDFKKPNQGESDINLSVQNPNLISPDSYNLRSWNVQFNYPLDDNVGAQAGVETDGNFFYVTQWNGDSIFKYSLTGTYISGFTMNGVSGLRDLAYDGTYFYGSNTSANIFEMDFTNQVLISTISAPVGTSIRNISYDNVNDGFWVGNWATDLDLINRTGALINSISASDHGLASIYGTAFDNLTAGGPYLWAINATSSVDAANLYQVNIATGQQTGIVHDIIPDLGLTNGLGGGLFIHSDIIMGTTTLGGLVQNQAVFGYDLLNLMDPIDASVSSIISPVTGVGLSNSENVVIEITNFGTTDMSNFMVSFNVNGGVTVTEVYAGIILFGETVTYTFATGIDLSAFGTYEINAFIDITGDGDLTNNMATTIVYSLEESAEKLVLIEHFTQASCAPCATQNPDLDTLITNAQNIDRVAHIAYHTSWPGSDPMYDFNDNNGEGNARVDYYNVSGVPNCVIAGNIAQGQPAIVDQMQIDTEYLRPGMFKISGTALATLPDNVLQIDLGIESLISSGVVKVLVVLVEEVNYASAPGSNGEIHFPDVMRRMFPDEFGTTINQTTIGNTDSIHFTYNIQAPVDPYATKLICFVQNDIDKEIYMATTIPVNVYNGIDDVENEKITVYPNPSTGIYNLMNTDGKQVTVLNVLGEVLCTFEASENQKSFDLSNYANGTYFVRIISNNEVVTLPISLNR